MRELLQHLTRPPHAISEGRIIVQRVAVGPFGLEMAVRVVAVWDREDGAIRDAGFSYATLQGHAKCGVETFRVEVLIEAQSQPGILLTRLTRPAARLFQRAITEAALRRLGSV